MRNFQRLVSILMLLAVGCTKMQVDSSSPQTLQIAAAANLQRVLPKIIAAYKLERANIRISVIYGASGVLAQQIESGAAHDIFLSANQNFVDRVASNLNLTVEKKFDFTRGRLVVCLNSSDLAAKIHEWSQLDWDAISRVVIANPKLAPFGDAAQQVLDKVGFKGEVVQAPDVSAVAQFISSGAADFGFTAKAVFMPDGNDSLPNNLRIIEISDDLYSPILQGGIVLTNNQAANDFATFLKSPEVQALFVDNGYMPLK